MSGVAHVMGVAAAVALVAVLAARDLLTAAETPRAQGVRRSLDRIAAPLLVVFLVVVAGRFAGIW